MAEVILLDGGMGQELVKRHTGPKTGLWGTKVMLEAPETVVAVHRDYIDAGATVITLNSYGLLHDRMERAGMLDKLGDLTRLACDLGKQARDQAGAEVAIAGSLGPMGWSYRPDIAPPSDVAAPLYAALVELQAPHVDLIIGETVSSVDTARGLLMGAAGCDKPVWLALSVDEQDGTLLRSGEDLNEISPLLEEFDVDATLLNCSPPEAIDAGLPVLEELGWTTGAYANGFTEITKDFAQASASVDLLTARTDLGPDAYADFALGWVDQGARILGGCCEVGPAHIARLKERLLEAGHTIRRL